MRTMKFNSKKTTVKVQKNTEVKGNISILALFLILLFAFIFLAVCDLCRIFAVREITKKAADAAALSVAQNILFFEYEQCYDDAREIVEKNYCQLCDLQVFYDEVIVSVKRDLNFILIARLFSDGCSIAARSKTKIIYPWDDYFGLCDSYRFSLPLDQ
ncbi:MAG: hypothetical protein FJW69_00700 [Actinobacteria bacterium]|nr:hypothetical protein [Actinomycetota bacterium]MBM3711970.1 hypothetical protein [Actinomycetota bacterium]